MNFLFAKSIFRDLKNRQFLAGLLATIALLVGSLTDHLGINDFGSKKSLDVLTQIFPYENLYADNSPGLIFVSIDDASINQLGQWPWPRQTIARIVDHLRQSHIAALGMDVLFLEQDRYAPDRMAADLGVSNDKIRSLGITDGDSALGFQLKETPSVLAFSLGSGPSKNVVDQNHKIASRFIVANNTGADLLAIDDVVLPRKNIQQSPGLGFVNALEEGGLIREIPLVVNYRDQLVPNLSLEMLRIALGANNYVIKQSDSGHALQIKVGNLIVQTDPNGQLLFHHGRTSRFQQISAVRLFQGPIPDLEGRIVIFGVNALGLGDQHATALEDALPGATLHLQALDQMLSQRFLTHHEGFDRMIYVVCAFIALIACFLIVHVPLFYALAIAVVSFFALIGISAYSFVQFGFVFNFFNSAAILVAGALVTYILQSIAEERLRKKMQTSFAQYVPPDVVKRISKSNQMPKLGGELIEASVLFLDLRGFTSLTEALKPHPELMVRVIGTIMDEVTARLIESGATIDKYIGDAVMAFWNAPERQDDHLLRALYGACRIQEDVDIIRNKIHVMDPVVKESKIAFGIGICCGPITVGNFGSSFRFNYTVLGDAVNTASRLESLTKEKNQPILIAANSLKDGQLFSFNERLIQVSLVGTTEIRGKTEVLNIFTAQFKEQSKSL